MPVVVVGLVVAAQLGVGTPALGNAQNDAGTGTDAGNTFTTATAVTPAGRYHGVLDRVRGDMNDFYMFNVPEGGALSVLVSMYTVVAEPVVLLDPLGRPVDTGVPIAFTGASASNAMTTEAYGLRLAVNRALVGGMYRLQLRAEEMDRTRSYELCFMNCEQPKHTPIDFIFGGSLRQAHTRVLLVPPTHGDLGNPAGPTADDYLQATLRGMHKWTDALDAFATDYPRFSYLRDITVDIEIFDGVDPADAVGYDVVVGYVAAGPVFRGVAADYGWGFEELVDYLAEDAHFDGRFIALSLFGASPRAGQVAYDFPEVNDLEGVTMHEFAHTFGLGHTQTWDAVTGPDLMNSPATFIYGDGFAGGDGGERTALECFSSLDLYGMAVLYRWLPSGEWQPTYESTTLPSSIPYELYC